MARAGATESAYMTVRYPACFQVSLLCGVFSCLAQSAMSTGSLVWAELLNNYAYETMYCGTLQSAAGVTMQPKVCKTWCATCRTSLPSPPAGTLLDCSYVRVLCATVKATRRACPVSSGRSVRLVHPCTTSHC